MHLVKILGVGERLNMIGEHFKMLMYFNKKTPLVCGV